MPRGEQPRFVPRPSSHRADDHTSLPSPLPTALSQTYRSRRPRRAPRRSSTPPRTCPAPPPRIALGALADDRDAQENDPNYKGAGKAPIKIGPKGKEFNDHYDIMRAAASATWRPWTR